jgi:hypothetical protein
MPSFSERQGFSQPKEIRFRDELPVELRTPIFDILRRSVRPAFLWERIEILFNPYGTDDWPQSSGPFAISREEDTPELIGAKRVLLNCPWFRVYDIIEDIFDRLDFHDRELRTDPEEEAMAFPFQRDINDYFKHVGIGWQLVNGKIVTRGNEAFEGTVNTAVAVLQENEKPTAAGHLQFAISALSARPKANTSGAVAHATNAVECVLGKITGQEMTLGKFLDKNPGLFHRALRKGLDGIYGYASDEGARHGKEGTEPAREEAEFAVAVCAAVCTLLTRKYPK